MSTKSFSSHLGGFAFQLGKLALGYKVGENTVPSEQQGEYSPNGPDQTIDLSSSAASLSAGPWVPGSICVLRDSLTLSDRLKFMSHDGSTEFVLNIANSGDTIWAHWENDSHWHDVTGWYTFPNSDYHRSEGELTDSQYPYLKAGLYRFTMEVALRNYPTVYDAVQKFDITIKYGAQALRAQSFIFDRTIPFGTGIVETVWFGGIFRMPADGAVSVYVESPDNLPANMKCSHIFINKLGD